MKQATYIFFVIFLASGCNDFHQPNIQLKDFSSKASVKELGQKLIDLPIGLNLLEPRSQQAEEIYIGVHGGRSEGYEWIYPLKIIDTQSKEMYFYRWRDNDCFYTPAKKLAAEIKELLNKNSYIKKVTLVGHSYGGILVSEVLKDWINLIPIEVHVVASPLLGNAMLRNKCNYEPIKEIPENSTFFEWRTQHQLDSVYKDLTVNPQEINIIGSSVTVLPDAYKGNRLGHNWSISWVAEKISTYQ